MDRRMRKIGTVLLMTFLLVSLFLGGGSRESLSANPATEVRVLKLVCPHNPTEFHYKAGFLPLINEIQTESKDKIKIDFYPSETLVKTRATPEAVQQGIAEMGYIVTTYHPAMLPLADVYSLPMLYTSAVQGWEWDNKVKGKYLRPSFEKAGFVCLGTFMTGPYYFFTTKREIKTLKDLSGLRLKSPGAPGTAFLKALGAQGILVSTWDVYEALSKGTLDGVIHSPGYMQTAKWHELANPGYLVWGGAGLSGSTGSLIVNKKVYESLSPELQKVLDVAGDHWGYNISKAYDENDTLAMAEFKKTKMVILILPPSDQERLKSLAGPVWDNWITENQSRGYPAKELVEELKQLGGGKKRYGQ